MANNVTNSLAARSAALDARLALLNVGGAGHRDVYSGVQPTSPDTAVGSQVRLAHLTFSSTAFAASVNGVATANAITADSSPVAGVATWYRDSSGAGTAVIDGTVGTSDADMIVPSTTIVADEPFAIASATYTQP